MSHIIFFLLGFKKKLSQVINIRLYDDKDYITQ